MQLLGSEFNSRELLGCSLTHTFGSSTGVVFIHGYGAESRQISNIDAKTCFTIDVKSLLQP